VKGETRTIAHRWFTLILCIAVVCSSILLPSARRAAFAAPPSANEQHPQAAQATPAKPIPRQVTTAQHSPRIVQPLPTQNTIHRAASFPVQAPSDAVLLANPESPDIILSPNLEPEEPSDPDCMYPPCTFLPIDVTVDYAGGEAWVSGSPSEPSKWAKDDGIVITFVHSGQQLVLISESADQAPLDISPYLQMGVNHLHVEALDTIPPLRGGGSVYLFLGADIIPPVISDVSWRQDGAGSTIVMATITDNVAVAAASLWWNGQEYPMQLMGPDRYYAIVPQEPNGVTGNFRITAVDPAGNLACWPPDCGTQDERIRYLIWAGLKANTVMAGEPVNTATGSFITQHQDVYASAPGMPFELKRTYNSMAAVLDGPLGFGWTHSFHMHLEVVDDPLLHGVVVTYPDGRIANFAASGGGYTSPPGDHNILQAEGGGFVLIQPDQVKYHFNSVGKLTSIKDRNGNTVQLAYTGDNLTQITDTAGRAYQLAYDGQHIVQITDLVGRTYQYAYNGAGDLVTYTDPAGGLLQYTYNDEHWLTSITDPNGHVFVTNTYDERGRVVRQIDASGSVSTWEYVDEYHVVFTDNEGNTTSYAYDEHLRIIAETNAAGSVTYEYDADDNPTLITDRGGHATAYTYDGMGNVLTRTDALNQTASFQYDAQNNLIYEQDEAGAATTYEYDAHGNQTRIHDAEGSDTRMTYDSRGLMLTQQDANGHTTEFEYGGQGNRIVVRDPLGNTTGYGYDPMGHQLAMTDANGHTAAFQYSPTDRLITTTDARGASTSFIYDPVGNLLSVTDRRGYTTLYEYDINDSLVKVTDPLGHFTTYTYDLMYHRTTVTNRRGQTTSYKYDAVYNVLRITDAKGYDTTFTHDTCGNVISSTDALGNMTAFEYDALHRMTRMVDARGGVTEYGYDSVGRLVSLRDPKGGATLSEYDLLGRLVTLTDALGNVTTFTYDPVGNRLTETNPRGYTTTYEYDAANRLVRQTDPLGHVQRFTYDGVGIVISKTDARGAVINFAYDENDNLVLVTDALGGQIHYAYDKENNQVAITDQNGHTTTTEYDALANPVRVTLPLLQETGYTYDENGNLLAVTNAKNKTTHLAYDELDLLVSRTDPLGNLTAYTYDPLGRMVTVTDAEGNATQYGYDALGRLVEVIDALGGQTTYEYDPLGNLTAFTDANSHRTWFDVDLLGQRTGEHNPLGNTWLYQFDAAGNLIQRTDANGAVTDYTFDGDNRLTNTVDPTGSGVILTYDENDNLIGVSDASGSAAFAYDALNRMTREQRTAGILNGKDVQYGYDPVGTRTQVIYPDGKVMTYEYNANNWLVTATDPIAGATLYEYDPVGLPTRMDKPNGTWTDYAYDDADRLVHLWIGKPQTSTDLVSSFDYTLDSVGNRIRTVEKVTRGQIITWDEVYAYDALYRLVSAVETPDYNPAQPYISQFTYDAVGNRLSMTTNIQDAPNTPPLPAPATTNYTYNEANQMLTAGAAQFGYDANGNRVAMQGPERVIDYTCDFENRLAEAATFNVQPNGKLKRDAVLDFTYDGLGRRVQRGVIDKGRRKTTDFLYDGLGYDMLAQYVQPESPRTTFYFRDLSQILSRYENPTADPGSWYAFHYDGLGSVSAWTNQTGGAVQEYKYAPYGRLIDNNGPDNASNRSGPHSAITFSGKLWDRELEQYYFGVRDYDPGRGVWLTQDLYRGRVEDPTTLHRYMYAGNNPVTLVDLYGLNTTNPGTAASGRSSSSATAYARNQAVYQGPFSSPKLKCLYGGTRPRSLPFTLDLDIFESDPSGQLTAQGRAEFASWLDWALRTLREPVVLEILEEALGKLGTKILERGTTYEIRHVVEETLVWLRSADFDFIRYTRTTQETLLENVSTWGRVGEYLKKGASVPGSLYSVFSTAIKEGKSDDPLNYRLARTLLTFGYELLTLPLDLSPAWSIGSSVVFEEVVKPQVGTELGDRISMSLLMGIPPLYLPIAMTRYNAALEQTNMSKEQALYAAFFGIWPK
jgi:RHS repeat-associated protein